jgi:putative ABC transport system permease protein
MAALNAVSISDGFFDTIGVRLALGRPVARRDVGNVRSVNISYKLWQRRLQGDPAVLGRQIEVNNNPMTVVGVLSRGFTAYFGPGVSVPPQVDVWYPRGKGYDDDPFRGQVVVARLKRDVSLDTARAAVDSLAKNLVASITYVGVALVLAVIAVVATALPAIRAVRVDSMLALRSE